MLEMPRFYQSHVPGWDCVEPESVLELLSASPDFRLLQEERAALAATIFADRMTDDELREFWRHVRIL